MSEKFHNINLTDNENIILVIKKHPIIFVFLGCYFLLVLIASFFLIQSSNIIIQLVGGKIFWLLFSIFLIISFCVGSIFWINVELDFLIVTNKKIISIQQKSFLNKEITEINLSKIQEIKSSIKGILPNIFGYGNISIFTANNQNILKFSYIPKPNENIQKINEIIQESIEK